MFRFLGCIFCVPLKVCTCVCMYIFSLNVCVQIYVCSEILKSFINAALWNFVLLLGSIHVHDCLFFVLDRKTTAAPCCQAAP